MGAYSCAAAVNGLRCGTSAEIGNDRIVIRGDSETKILFAEITDMRLVNYHVNLSLKNGSAEFSGLGYDTENFFEELWDAYSKKSLESLFVSGGEALASEGDYWYAEEEGSAKSIARLMLYPDCLVILPHDIGARRVPLVFSAAPVRSGFSMEIHLDTGERYRISRLGRDTDPFFSTLLAYREQALESWNAAHRALSQKLSLCENGADPGYETLRSLGVRVESGLFSPEDEAFWFAGLSAHRAAVELRIGEAAATYLYQFQETADRFLLRIRHAMEAVRQNRRLIFLPEEELLAEPILRMSVDRSSHVRFLRLCNAGRIIHTEHWADRLRQFFLTDPP